MSNICVIHVYWNPIPKWFPYFICSCASNPSIHFLLFTNEKPLCTTPDNVKHILFTPDDFNKLASQKLQLSVNIKTPYKICDFKPSFGKVFEDYLAEYDFWGYCDSDLVFGDIRKYISSEILYTHDIISSYRGFLSGSFSLLRNTPHIVSLYSHSKYYKDIFSDPYHCFGYDENIPQKRLWGVTTKKIVRFISMLWNIFWKKGLKIKWFREYRYQFQWDYKKQNLNKNNPGDMTDIVWSKEADNSIRCYFCNLMDSDNYYKRIHLKNWKLKWKNGSLINQVTKKEVFGFHFLKSKFKSNFIVKPFRNNTKEFYITQSGFDNKIDC